LLEDFNLELLAPSHRREQFDCGSASLNRFIREQARKQSENGTTRVHVYASSDGVIAGFFTLSSFVLELVGLPAAILKGRPKMPVPSTLLGRFAVAVNYQHRGVGTFLLGAALHQAYANSQTVASAFVVLDIADDASETAPALYRGFGFSPLPSDPRRMLLSMESIRLSL
jgi:GNAT superfamily N-acetyltransferase